MDKWVDGRQLQFRSMEAKDIPAAAAIERKLFSRPWSEQAFSESMGQDALFVVTEYKGVILGHCGMYCSLGEGEVMNVAVAPEWQNLGIGRQMLGYLLGEARKRGVSHVILEVRVSNANAIHLYETLGFRNCGIRKGLYEMPREDGMVMSLDVK